MKKRSRRSEHYRLNHRLIVWIRREEEKKVLLRRDLNRRFRERDVQIFAPKLLVRFHVVLALPRVVRYVDLGVRVRALVVDLATTPAQ